MTVRVLLSDTSLRPINTVKASLNLPRKTLVAASRGFNVLGRRDVTHAQTG